LTDLGAGRAGASAKNKNGQRLIGWKAIGQYLGCTERTARRWEADRALPVHRIPGGSRGSVWAHPDELTTWLQTLPTDVQASLREEASNDANGASPGGGAPLDHGSARRGPARWLAGALAAAILVAAGTAALKSGWLSGRTVPPTTRTPYDDSPEARETYNTARFEVSERSAGSLAAAERGFKQLVDRYPERAAGWSGLADTYLLQREFGSVPDEVAYPQAERAARMALALDRRLADAWLDQAFIAWWWHGDGAVAFRAFDTALRLDPASARAYHWYATALYSRGAYSQALEAIARARALAPGNRAIVADEAWIRFGTGQRAEALATLEQLARLDPQFPSWHSYLAHAYLIESRDEDFLREARIAAGLRGQQDALAGLTLAEQQFRAGGHRAMLEELAADEEQRWARGSGSAVVIAEYHALAGDRPAMLRWLEVAEQRHEHYLIGIQGFPEFAGYVNDLAFRRIVSGEPATDRMASGE
jgi:tetratricopeptide (TPR) repeat protein